MAKHSKKDPVKRESAAVSGSEPTPKRAKGELDKEQSFLTNELVHLNEALDSFNTSSLMDTVQAHRGDLLLGRQLGERLVQLLQKTKAISAALREPSRRQRTILSVRDVLMPNSTIDFEASPIWRQQIKESNALLLASLAELLGEREEAEMAHLNIMVDAFAEELDQIRQSEDLGPNKLELLIDSLKTGTSSR